MTENTDKLGWGKYIRHFKDGTTATNIKPVDEAEQHQDFIGCKCNPIIHPEDDIVRHNAFDNREKPKDEDLKLFEINLDY